MSLIKTWSPHFQSGVRMRGRAYQQEGRVRRLTPRAGELARAEVQGAKTYTVVIKGEGEGASATCNCAFFAGGTYCKHIWATILDLHHNPDAVAASGDPAMAGSSLVADEQGEADGRAEFDGPGPRPPKARKRGAGDERPVRKREAAWVGRLSVMRMMMYGDTSYAAASARQLCYVISSPDPVHDIGGGTMTVRLHQREPTQTGWGRIKRLRISGSEIAALPDGADREICALLISSGRSSRGRYDSSEDTFDVPRGAWRALLRRMVESGRCFLGGEDADREVGEPLAWDAGDAWIPWLVCRAQGDDLVVNLELRRGEDSTDIRRPSLLLTGSDGVIVMDGKVGALDDRGAARWIRDFRDERYGSEGRSGALRVPLADAGRFLETLYALPQLPEIDLPPDLGVSERHIAPVPHLDVFTPDRYDNIVIDKESSKLAVAIRAPKGQLIARAWFAYGEHRVRPHQSGRFLRDTESAEAASATTDGDEPRFVPDAQAAPDAVEEGDAPVPSQDFAPPMLGPSMIRRDTQRELDDLAKLPGLGFRPHPAAPGGSYLLPAKNLPDAVGSLLAAGWVVAADKRPIRYASPPRLTIASGIDWFELHGSVTFQTDQGDQQIALPELLAALRTGGSLVTLGDGSQGLLPQEWLAQHGLLAALGKVEGDHLRFKTSQAAILDAMLDKQTLVEVDARFDEARRRLAEFQGIKPVDPAASFQGTLRPYQREGLGWMAFLRWFGMGGVLADDMGLGKTIQVLAMLDSRRAEMAQGLTPRKPSLIVVPRSVVFNWIDEARHFAPDLRMQAYTGAGRDALREAFTDHDVIVTSYGLMRRDIAELAKHEFDYVVLDEAQAIKNPGSQAAKSARLLQSDHRLALSGTPVENHLGDLWSIFEYLNPGMLGSSTGFGRLIRGESPGDAAAEAAPHPTSGNGNGNGNGKTAADDEPRSPRHTLDPRATLRIAQALRPFILRRTKQQVLRDLPEKTEQTIVCELEPEQRALYDQLKLHYRASLLGASGVLRDNQATLGGGSAMMVLEALLRLRQAACHPGLIDAARADQPSAKIDTLLEQVAQIVEEKHKALVFSQFTSLLALVRKRLDERGLVYEYLDGQTRDRRERVQRFQTDPKCPLFLISLKAGGLGLNLTAAEYVFILDPWWNPAVEAQAIDRAHRIGQKQHVFAYRLICKDTVEERIAELQQKKKKLADAIVGGQENLLRNLTRDDLDALLA